MKPQDFGMDTITLAGTLESKLAAIRAGGFTHVMLSARDIVGHPQGDDAAIAAVRASGLRVTGLQVMRDFEGLGGALHDYKLDVAKSMLRLCHALGSTLLLVCSSTSRHATGDPDALVADLCKLATLAIPLNIRIAYEALSWGRHVNKVEQAWSLIAQADRSNLGLVIDSFHSLASGIDWALLEEISPEKVYFVQLSDFMWEAIPSFEDRIETARHFRVFPGEGVHGEAVTRLIQALDDMGYAGDYSFEVFNDDYVQMPPGTVVERANRAVRWVIDRVPRQNLPVRRRPA